MKITQKQVSKSLGSIVNRVGTYLKNNIDGAYNLKKSSNTCDVYMMVLYQIPQENRRPNNREDEEMLEMDLDINVVGYDNKIRVNVIEVSESEKTLGSYTYKKEQLEDLEKLKDSILDKIQKKLIKEYSDYDFVF